GRCPSRCRAASTTSTSCTGRRRSASGSWSRRCRRSCWPRRGGVAPVLGGLEGTLLLFLLRRASEAFEVFEALAGQERASVPDQVRAQAAECVERILR